MPSSFTLAGVMAMWIAASVGAADRQNPGASCGPAGPLVSVRELPEGSGVAVSHRDRNRLWAHNDSAPVLFALDTKGTVTDRVRLTGAPLRDWEAISSGPCPAGSCLYLADIGDNNAVRPHVSIYRIPEPAAGASSASVTDVLHARYPDGPHDAETLLIAPDGRLFIVTKGDREPVAVYRVPHEFRAGATVPLERVGTPYDIAKPKGANRITDGVVSPDGVWVVLRTNTALVIHRAATLLAGRWNEVRRIDLKVLGEPQGEGVALGADNFLYLVGEAGMKTKGGGTFARFTCAL